jgi:HlyD family secretion protein
MKKRRTLAGLIALAAAVLLAGCGGAGGAETVAPEDVPVVAGDADGKIVAEGTIVPARSSELTLHAAGDVVAVLVQEGDAVKASDPLIRLETTDLERAMAQADISLRQAQVSLE